MNGGKQKMMIVVVMKALGQLSLAILIVSIASYISDTFLSGVVAGGVGVGALLVLRRLDDKLR